MKLVLNKETLNHLGVGSAADTGSQAWMGCTRDDTEEVCKTKIADSCGCSEGCQDTGPVDCAHSVFEMCMKGRQ